MEISYTKNSKSVNLSYKIIYLFLIKVLSRTQKLILSVFNSRVEINENYISKKKGIQPKKLSLWLSGQILRSRLEPDGICANSQTVC